MLGKRLSEPRRVVSIYDPAFFEFDAETRDRYINTRDFSLLGDVAKLPNPPTVFTLDPARPEHQHLLDQYDLPTCTGLFRMYVSRVEHCDVDLAVETVNGVRRLTDECAAQFGTEVVGEIGGLVQAFARSDTTPFMPPDGYSGTVRGMLIRRAYQTVSSPKPVAPPTD